MFGLSRGLILPRQIDEAEFQIRRQAHDLGRIAFRAGLKIKACPGFKCREMAANWRVGWKYEKRQWAKKQRGRAR